MEETFFFLLSSTRQPLSLDKFTPKKASLVSNEMLDQLAKMFHDTIAMELPVFLTDMASLLVGKTKSPVFYLFLC